jgi:hypothetical protein
MNAEQYIKVSKTPEKFLKAIPKDVQDNIAFRKDLHGYLCTDEKAVANYLALSFLDPVIFFNSSLWTFNSQLKHKHWLFILWPHQEVGVRSIKAAIEDGQDRFFKKSRKQGATYINLGVLLLYFLVNPDERFLLGSRKENLVDDGSEIKDGSVIGSEETLFYKLLYMFNTMPKYLQPPIYKKNLFMQSLANGAAFKGEATNLGFGKAFRARVSLVDEAAQIEPKEASYIIENLADTAPTNIFNSTTGPWGGAHPYSKLMVEHPDKVVELSFYDNPEQGAGRYTSPEDGKILIKDIDYYRKKYTNMFTEIEQDKVYNVIDLPKCFPFIADGNISNFGCDRTAWLDNFERDKAVTPRGKSQNLLMIDSGSTDMFFQFGLLEKLRDKTRQPYYKGDINYTLDKDSYIYETQFESGGQNSILSWWGILTTSVRPFQGHNYVVGCDISKGTGTTNSVAAVLNVNTNEIEGLLVTPYLPVIEFAEKVVALCEWIGGNNPPLLIWEENAMPDFLKRLDELGYYNMFVKEDLVGKKKKSGNKYGWRSTSGPNGTKVEVMNYLDGALHEGLKENPRFTPLKIYDEQTVNEMESYVWFEGKIDIGPAAMQTETSGAKASHGDRVIAVAIANYGKRQQQPGDGKNSRFYPENSWMARKANKEAKDERQKQSGKQWWS